MRLGEMMGDDGSGLTIVLREQTAILGIHRHTRNACIEALGEHGRASTGAGGGRVGGVTIVAENVPVVVPRGEGEGSGGGGASGAGGAGGGGEFEAVV